MLAVGAVLALPLNAQDGTRHYGEVRETPWGHVLDFTPDGAWRREARRVRERRQALLADRNFAELNAPGMASVAVAGTRRVPAILFSFADSARATAYDTSQFRELLFGDPAPAGRPYSMRTYFGEISNGLITMLGEVVGWIQLAGGESAYTGPFGGCPDNVYGTNQCNGVWSGTAFTAMQNGLREALAAADATGIDWGLFDNDGPDGVPNSGDDDGFVDLTIFVHSEEDGACASNTNNHLWAHRSSVSFTTSTPRSGGGFIAVSSYTIQSGVGGGTACDETAIMPIGTAAHETGHAFGLPDLYTSVPGLGQGIGHWGLMGSGNYRLPHTPAYMSSWARAELGWVTSVLVDRDTTITLSPVETSDTVLIVPVANSNEYFMLENRQPLGSDVAIHGPGLLIWHADSVLIRQRRFGIGVNQASPYGLAVEQADGQNHLLAGTNRGDGGDPFPGTANRIRFSYNTVPSSARNNGVQSYVTVDSISQVSPAGPVRFVLTFGVPITVAVAGNGTVTGAGLTIPGTTLVTDTVTLTATPDAGYIFDGWSGDTVTSQPTIVLPPSRAWNVIATHAALLALVPLTSPGAVMGAHAQITLGATGGIGTYVWTLASGALPPGMSLNASGVVLGVPEQTGTFNATLQVRSGSQTLSRDVAITVSAPPLATPTVVGVLLGSGATLTADEVRYLDLLGNRDGSFDIGDFLAWVLATGATPTAAEMGAVLGRMGGTR